MSKTKYVLGAVALAGALSIIGYHMYQVQQEAEASRLVQVHKDECLRDARAFMKSMNDDSKAFYEGCQQEITTQGNGKTDPQEAMQFCYLKTMELVVGPRIEDATNKLKAAGCDMDEINSSLQEEAEGSAQ